MAAPSVSTSSPVSYFSSSPSDNNNINALIQNVKWGQSGLGTGATVYYSFPTSNSAQLWGSFYRNDSGSETYNDFAPLSEAQETAAISAFNTWSNLANLDFIEVSNESFTSVGDIRIANSGALSAYTYAYAYLPALNNPVGGDVWFNTSQPISSGNDYTAGGNGFQTMMHEIGHALGLDHPFEGDVTLSNTFNQYQYSIMSYSDIPNQYDTGYSTFYPTTPMLLDVLAIQYLYGANMSYNNGDNVYRYGDDYAYETIWDAGGADTIEYTGNLSTVINLNAGEFSSIGPSVKANRGISAQDQDNIAIAYNVTIENAIGGSGNDTIYGNAATNTINGGAGNDTFVTSLSLSDLSSLTQSGDQYLLVSNQATDYLQNIESIQFTDGTYSLTSLLSDNNQPITTPSFSSYVDGTSSTATPETYTGPVDYLQYQLIGSGSNESVIGAETNDFINLLGGDDAANGGGGNDVLDGGTGSNFLTGSTGSDTFFLDGRGDQITWSTITDFNGDGLTVWGWRGSTSQILFEDTNGGTAGYTGATLHLDLDGDNFIDTSITFSGLGLNDISNQQFGTSGGEGYLYIV